MYSEWASLHNTILTELADLSVLNKFPPNAGKDVATAVVKQLAQNLGISSTSHCEQSTLQEDKDVLWCMEVLSYGLSLPLSEHDTIRDSVNVYCEWLLALLKPKICVPKPVCEDPNRYARIMIKHFYSLFVPRSDSNPDTINRQAVLCHRVLRMLQKIARESKILVRETWEAMLMFLLAINDTLLAPPTVKDDIGDQLCERIVSVLFEIWLSACAHSFPSPSLWKTFHDMCIFWRHRSALIEQWNRVNIALTSRLLKFMYGPGYPELKIGEDVNLLPLEMNNEEIAQSWFRFFHILGNPVELCYPTSISNTPQFLHYAITSEHVVDPCQHKCLYALPQIFLKAMRGMSVLVDSFLGIAQYSVDGLHLDLTRTVAAPSQHSNTPPQLRKPAKAFGAAATKGIPKPSLIGLSTSKTSITSSDKSHQSSQTTTPISVQQPYPFGTSNADARVQLAQARPKCNSILHLFGVWLFEAALVGSKFNVTSKEAEKTKRPSSLVLEAKRASGPPFPYSSDIPPELKIEQYESGRAEAIGTLCRIFCAKKTGEDILPVYLARFYLAIQQGLKVSEKYGGQVLCGILMNSCNLLRLDLDGVMVLIPDIIESLEKVLNEKELQFISNYNVSLTDLRRAGIHLLLSMLPLPLHFRALPIKDMMGGADKPQQKFQNFRLRLSSLLVSALQSETDAVNTQMLLGGLLFSIQDIVTSEEEEQAPLQQDGSCDSTTGLLVSVNLSDAFSSHSASDCTASSFEDYDSFNDNITNVNNDSSYAIYVRSIYMVCQRLISSWKTDFNVSLAALEALSGFAKIKMPDQVKKVKDQAQPTKLSVKWICDYIVHQCSRPPQFHSKDLHSTIVAAFHCVTTWLLEHPYLLEDPDCLNTIMEVVELGISGSKSVTKQGDLPRMKGEKENKPASMRVRDAAESVLTYILEHVGYFPSPCGQASVSSLLDEENLLSCCNSWNDGDRPFTRESALKQFKYYVIDKSVILALFEQPLGNDQDPQPTVTVLSRGPFGRNAWTMQLRHLPRHKSGTKMYPVNPGRPVPMNEHHVKHSIRPRYFPESVNRIQSCKAERSIPPLESLITENGAEDHDKLSRLLETQIAFERNIEKKNQEQKNEYPNPETECKAPTICQEFETARMFLSHFGFLSLEALNETLESRYPSLLALNSNHTSFAADVEALDNMSNRTCDTAFIFYVKVGQKNPQEILNNVMSSQNVNPHFFEFLLSLGWPVDVAKHPGWTGHVSTSWKIVDEFPEESPSNSDFKNHGGSLYNGQKKVLYWSDAMSEIAFVVPTARRLAHDASPTCDSAPESLQSTTVSFERGSLERQTMPPPNTAALFDLSKPRTLSLELEKPPLKDKDSPSDPRARKMGRQPSSAMAYDTKVLIVWLERFEDHFKFPIGDLLNETSTGPELTSAFMPRLNENEIMVIFIHALQNGLFRIIMQGQTGKISMAIPLVDGMVVSRRVLGMLVRQTALNMCLRKRLENDTHYPPHLRRKLKIQEIVHKYQSPMSEPQFYTSLFSNPPN